MARQDDVATIVRDPAWFPYRYDAQHDTIHYIRAERETQRAAAFLRDEYLPGHSQPVPLGREEVMAASAEPAPVHFVFHSAYCCSTLIARAFDAPGHAMGLKEPLILNDLVGWNHRGAPRDKVAMLIDQSLRLLGRPYGPGEAVVIKPSNIVNGLIPAMLKLRPQSRALLLYAPLDRYLPSIAKKSLQGRLWVRTLLIALIKEGRIDLGFRPDQYLDLSDLQVAAIGWIAQHAQFQRLVEQFGDRVATLNSEALLALPGPSMTKLDALFGTKISAADIDAIVKGPAFGENSKTFTSYSTTDRDAEKAKAESAYADELEWVTGWAHEVAKRNAIPMDLPGALLER